MTSKNNFGITSKNSKKNNQYENSSNNPFLYTINEKNTQNNESQQDRRSGSNEKK